MITTKQINVNLEKGNLKHRQVTTKNIDAGVRVEPPKEPIKSRSVSTNALPTDIDEKRKRDAIMAERKKAEERNVPTETEAMNESFDISDAVYQEEEFKRMNTQYVFVDVDGIVQAVSRRELK